ncbi:MAG: carbohydrate-binding family 9-like protein [Pyrinomonadaceae bacterium]|nr:carbohydrate-binding family 9-like protein [Pyrinomonadaceae bacterium]
MTDKIKIAHVENDFSIGELDNKSWKKANDVEISKYWSGENAPDGRHFKAKLLWSKTALYVRFEANQAEPLVISDAPNLKNKTKGLWDRDVCEIFLAPNRAEFRKYFEFEIAPTGEWIDLGIHQKPNERITDWDYDSGMQSAARVEKDKVIMAIKVEWKAFGTTTPKAGDIWLGNILRCVGAGATRGYLTWQPTLTKEPSFHVPEKFGEFEFIK